MSVRIETIGVSKLISDMEGYTKDVHKRIVGGLQGNGNKVVNEAKANHRFQRVSGQLENSVTFEQELLGDVHIAKIYLKDSALSVDTRSYGTFIHEGTYDGYDQSPIADAYSNTSGSAGWQADPFLYNAIVQEWDFGTTLFKIARNLRNDYQRL